MADVLIEHKINAVIVLREFSNRDKAKFVSQFAERLFAKNRDVLHLFCEEAHELMPQQPYKGEEEMLGRMLRLQKLGRTSGIGLTSITQRPASLNKNATNLAEVLISHRLLGAQDRAAIEGWIKYHNEEGQKEQVLSTLPQLRTGEAWIWSPAWPEDAPLGLLRVQVLMPETFDSRRTPRPGERRVEPKKLQAVDLEKLRSKMAATIERAKSDDPNELRRKIRALETQLRAQPARTVTKPVQVADPRAVERAVKQVEVQLRKDIAARETIIKRLTAGLASLAKTAADLADVKLPPIKQLELPKPIGRGGVTESASWRTRPAPVRRPTDSTPVPRSNPPEVGANSEVKGTPLKILRALADFEALGRVEVARPTLASWCGVKHTTGTFSNYLSELRTRGLIEDSPDKKKLRLTGAGSELAGPAQAPVTTEEMLERCLAIMKGTAGKMLKVLHDRHPDYLSYDELGQNLDPSISGETGTFSNYISALNVAEMIEKGPNRTVRCADWIFVD